MELHVVLYEPEIPQNTGNIARTCAATGTSLHLIEPLGFSIDDRAVKRAGLDYWHLVDIHRYPDLESYLESTPGYQRVFATKKLGRPYSSINYSEHCSLILGRETTGLPEDLLARRSAECVRLPMREDARSLNLSNVAAVLVYEALKQTGFPGLRLSGTGLQR